MRETKLHCKSCGAEFDTTVEASIDRAIEHRLSWRYCEECREIYAESLGYIQRFAERYKQSIIESADGESYTLVWTFPRPFPPMISLKDMIDAFGLDLSESPPSAYSPTGRWFHGRVIIDKSRRWVILSQRYALDV